MHYKIIYEIASTPLQAIEQLVLNRFHEPDALVILLGFPLAMAWLLWMRKVHLKGIIFGVIGSEITLILSFCIWFIGFSYPQHMQLAQIYLSGKSEQIEGPIANLKQLQNHANSYFQVATFTVNGKEINFSSRSPGFNDPFDKNIKVGSIVHIWLTDDPKFKQVILRFDAATDSSH